MSSSQDVPRLLGAAADVKSCRVSISATSSAERLVSCFMARSKAARSAGATTSASRIHEVERARAPAPRRPRGRPASATGTTRAGRRGWRAGESNLRCSSWATARETLVLCIWVCGADRLAGHHAVLAERHQHPPLGYSDTVTAIDPRERLRDQAGEDVEPVRQETLRASAAAPRWAPPRLNRAVTDWTGVHHRPRPRALDAVRLKVRPPRGRNIGRRSQACNGDAGAWPQRDRTGEARHGTCQARSSANCFQNAGVIEGTRWRRIRRAPSSPVGHGDRPGDLVAVDFAEGCRPGIVARLAIGGGDRHPATRAGRQAAVDAVAVGIVGDDEGALLGLRGRGENGGRERRARRTGTASLTPPAPGFPEIGTTRTMRGKLKAALTRNAPPRHQQAGVSGLWRCLPRTGKPHSAARSSPAAPTFRAGPTRLRMSPLTLARCPSPILRRHERP